MKDPRSSSPTRIADIAAIQDAADLLRAGDLVAFPTETVYGLAADARNPAAIQKIYDAKSRPPGNPLIVHVADGKAARECVTNWPTIAEKLADHFWPGPLTLILPRSSSISPLVSAGRNSVALRVPNHPVAQALLRACNFPLAAPSANRSGFTSPTTAQHVFAELNGRVPLILDGGECQIGLESTVVDLTVAPPAILRPGAITAAMLEKIIGPVQTNTAIVHEQDSAASPGQHARHYAPRTPAYRFSKAAWSACGPSPARYAAALAGHNARVVLITFDPAVALPPPHETMLLSASPEAYGRSLYASLRQADELGASSILVLMPDTNEGLWAAIIDRLNRATVPFGFH